MRNCQKIPPCPAEESLPAPRWTWLQAKAEQARNYGNVSVITHLKRKRSDYADAIAARAEQDENM